MEKINFENHYPTIRDYANVDSTDYKQILDLALSNKTISKYSDGTWYSDEWENLDLVDFLKSGRLQYSIEEPVDTLKFTDNHLVVVFPGAGTILDSDVSSRIYGKSKFSSMSILSKSVIKNTYILRIADSNLISGSYFWNTQNYPTYEEDIQQLILKIRDHYAISHENTLLWGESRGAVGALIHGLLGGYKTVSVDPIVNRKFFIDEDDYHFQFNLVPVDFVPKLNLYASKTKALKEDLVILTHHDSIISFPFINELDRKSFTILDLNYDLSVLKLTTPKAVHGYLIAKSVPIQLALINKMLSSSDLIEISKSKESDLFF